MTAKRRRAPTNPWGQVWNKGRKAISLRLPKELEYSLRELTLMPGDLSLIITAALTSMNLRTVEPVATRYAGLELGRPMMVTIATALREKLHQCAEDKNCSINAILITVLRDYFNKFRYDKPLREEVINMLRARRGI